MSKKNTFSMIVALGLLIAPATFAASSLGELGGTADFNGQSVACGDAHAVKVLPSDSKVTSDSAAADASVGR